MKDKRRIGYAGELLVASVLPGAEHANDITDTKLPYDLIWQGIKIDVKTTTIGIGSLKSAFNFNVIANHEHQDVILVLVALLVDERYFWVDNYSLPFKSYRKSKDSISIDKLADAILDASKTKIPIPFQTRQFSSVRISLELLDDIRRNVAPLDAKTDSERIAFILRKVLESKINYKDFDIRNEAC